MDKQTGIALGIGAIALVGIGAAVIASSKPAEAAIEEGMASLSGRITNSETNQPISGARVTLGSALAYTNSDGRYYFNDVEPGTYPLTIEADGYQTVSL